MRRFFTRWFLFQESVFWGSLFVVKFHFTMNIGQKDKRWTLKLPQKWSIWELGYNYFLTIFNNLPLKIYNLEVFYCIPLLCFLLCSKVRLGELGSAREQLILCRVNIFHLFCHSFSSISFIFIAFFSVCCQ